MVRHIVAAQNNSEDLFEQLQKGRETPVSAKTLSGDKQRH